MSVTTVLSHPILNNCKQKKEIIFGFFYEDPFLPQISQINTEELHRQEINL